MGRDNKIAARFWPTKKVDSNDFSLSERNETSTTIQDGQQQPVYRTYKRRWFGLLQLTLMNIVVSWDVRIKSLEYSIKKAFLRS